MRAIFLLLFSTIIISQTPAQSWGPGAFGLVAPKLTNCTSVKDQYLSATCWSFASNSLLESELLRKGKNIDLSEMFVARYSMIRKIKTHLLLKGSNFFTPGGQFHDMVWVLKNYGIVPESVYPGRPRHETNHDHGELDTLLHHFVTGLVNEGVQQMNPRQERYVDSVLDYYLGKVPEQFQYNGKTYTPKRFLKDELQVNPDDYVEITSYTHHPFYTRFILEDKYNWTGDAYYNVTMNDFSAITDSALAHGYTVGWDGDAQDPNFDYNSGLALLPVETENYQAYRQQAFTDESTLLDHMMHIVGVTKDRTGKKWYYVKNSWGDASNPLGGYLFMRDDYFRIRTVAIIVNKQAIPVSIRKQMHL